MHNNCEDCEFQPVAPSAKFMFITVERCQNCGQTRRRDANEVR